VNVASRLRDAASQLVTVTLELARAYNPRAASSSLLKAVRDLADPVFSSSTVYPSATFPFGVLSIPLYPLAHHPRRARQTVGQVEALHQASRQAQYEHHPPLTRLRLSFAGELAAMRDRDPRFSDESEAA